MSVPVGAKRVGVAFLNDIAHSAGPTFSSPGVLFPDDDELVGGSLDKPLPAGSYDDELLDKHFICGDGRCNENIGLTAVHQVFHMEHDRLVDDIKATLATQPDLLEAFKAVNKDPQAGFVTFNYGERLFQAARFVTEMEYQHLVFEEFARKVQPAINPFEAFAFGQTDIDPAITAEFAHAVYRFGHSMLTETLPRINAPEVVNAGAPLHNDIGLLEGFLNPKSFYESGNSSITLNSVQATASLIMGMSDQAGNEIDEFVTDTLRNNLLGLPLDLASLNMARARSEGVPSLNNTRKKLFAKTNDGQLHPYINWIDFDQNIKHHVSLVNFIAAYGKHRQSSQRKIQMVLGQFRLVVWKQGVWRQIKSSMVQSCQGRTGFCSTILRPGRMRVRTMYRHLQTVMTSCSALTLGRMKQMAILKQALMTLTCGWVALPRSPTCSAVC